MVMGQWRSATPQALPLSGGQVLECSVQDGRLSCTFPVSAALSSAPARELLAELISGDASHDHEEFYINNHRKLFAIMKRLALTPRQR
jgi:hypothetical protein